MDAERWREIERLYHRALELEASRRGAFLMEACGTDDDLCGEVESLLAQESKAEGFMEKPALEIVARALALDDAGRDEFRSPPPQPGAVVSHYRIIERLGAGGMGVVYKAEDTRLVRAVALKFLSVAAVQLRGTGTPADAAPSLRSGQALKGGATIDPQALERFQREARAAAALNHPNICAIYDVGEHDGQPFISMELVQGETLAERLTGVGHRAAHAVTSAQAGIQHVPAVDPRFRGGDRERRAALQRDDALAIAKQVAEALEYAHEHGIIHRDLKPSNIKVTPDGTVKVLDFGLAKLARGTGVSLVGLGGHGQDAHATPATEREGEAFPYTDTPAASLDPESLTTPGMIMGTSAYMSPEQARGQAVDRRCDIWAFGCVLYEMLAGKKAFAGEVMTETLAAVLKTEPDWNAVPAETPFAIQRLARRCLVKDPKQRLRDIGDARITIEEALAGDVAPGFSPAGTVAPQRPPWRRALPWGIAAALCLVIAALFAVAYFRATFVAERVVRSSILPPEKASFAFDADIGGPVISPDGRRIVFAARDSSGKEMLWVRSLDSLSAQPLEATQGAYFPFWSPDSRFAGFFASGKLMKIDVSSGLAQTLCDAPDGSGGTWSANGVIVFAPSETSGLEQVPAVGGTPRTLIRLDKFRQQITLRWPDFLPDGRHFIYWAGNPVSQPSRSTDGIYLASLDGKDRDFLFQADSDALYASPGFLLFLKDETLMAQPFDASRLKLTGEAFPVAEHVANPSRLLLGHFSVSQHASLVYETGAWGHQDQVAWIDARGKQLGTVGEPGHLRAIRLSPDGKSLAEVVPGLQPRNFVLWVMDLARSVRTRLTFNPDGASDPVWSPDGTRVAFSSNRKGQFGIYEKAANGTGTTHPLLEDSATDWVNSWSPDGRYIAYERLDPQGKTGWSIWILPTFGDKKPFPVLQSRFNELQAQFSPNGKWLAYVSDGTGRADVYVAPFPQGNGKWQVSTGGGSQPIWRRDGKELFYLSAGKELMAVGIQEKGGSLEIGAPQALFQTSPPEGLALTYAVTADGKKFVVLTRSTRSSPAPITLVVNWPALLNKK